MVRSVTLLTVIVTLTLGRPHRSCTDARSEAHAGTKNPSHLCTNSSYSSQCTKCQAKGLSLQAAINLPGAPTPPGRHAAIHQQPPTHTQ